MTALYSLSVAGATAAAYVGCFIAAYIAAAVALLLYVAAHLRTASDSSSKASATQRN